MIHTYINVEQILPEMFHQIVIGMREGRGGGISNNHISAIQPIYLSINIMICNGRAAFHSMYRVVDYISQGKVR